MRKLRVAALDLDGSIMPQGGPLDPRIAAIMRGIQQFIPLWPATGKNHDYTRGLGCGAGLVWDGSIAESGGNIVKTLNKTPPAFEEIPTGVGESEDLFRFERMIDLRETTFFLPGKGETSYRKEAKRSIRSLFPPGTETEVTIEWAGWLEGLIELAKLNLKLQRHKDGCIDIVPIGVSKRLGIEVLCRIYTCEPENILTVVDGTNDVELAEGTTPIAVSNAADNIKELARRFNGYIAKHPDGEGFAEGLLYFASRGSFGEDSPAVTKIVRENFPGLVPHPQ